MMSFPEFDTRDELFVSAKQVDEFVKDDYEVFLLLDSIKAENKVVIDELIMVCDFMKVFPYDVSNFPPEREVEFTIDLITGTCPMLMAPYKIHYLDLSELKKQLEEFLEKKFFRLRVSLRGAPVLLVKKKGGSMMLYVNHQ